MLINMCFPCLTETDDKMRAIAEKVFASETKDEHIRDEISMFDVAEDCPILHQEMAHHLHTEDDAMKRWEWKLQIMLSLFVNDEKWCLEVSPPIQRKRLQRCLGVAQATAAPEEDRPTYLEVPDFQRVAILGDYAAGVRFHLVLE